MLLFLASCGSRAGGTGTVTPEGGAPPGPDGSQDQHVTVTAAELEKRLGELKVKRDAAKGTAMSDVNTCEDLCDLATSICEVAKKLEVIANRHSGNETYQQLKREAQLECHDAMESCTNCVSGFESTQPEEPKEESASPPQ